MSFEGRMLLVSFQGESLGNGTGTISRDNDVEK